MEDWARRRSGVNDAGTERPSPPRASTSSNPCLQARREEVAVGDRGAVVAGGDRDVAGPRHQHDHHRHPGQRAKSVLPQDLCARDEGVAGVDRHIAGLHIGVDDRTGHRLEHRVRQQAEHRSDDADHVHGALVSFSGHLRPDALDPLRGVDYADGRREIDSGESVAARGIVVGPHVDRNRHRQRVDRHAHVFVVKPQCAAQSGQVCVVDRAFGRLGGPVQITEHDVDRIAARRQAAPLQHRRRRGRRPHHPGARHRVVHGAADRRDRVTYHLADRLHGAEYRIANPARYRSGKPVEPLPHKVVRRQVLRNG